MRRFFQIVDRYSTQWVTAWIGDGNELNNWEFEVTTVCYLGLPIPALVPHVGERIGNTGRTVDAYGFALSCASTTGDDWSIAHDGYLAVLSSELKQHGVHNQREISGLFRSCIPDPVQRERYAALPKRTRRGKVPDLRASFLNKKGVMVDEFLELKTVHVGPSRYSVADANHPGRCRSVERRASVIHKEYVDKARQTDQEFCGTSPGEIGPVERRLCLFGDEIGRAHV